MTKSKLKNPLQRNGLTRNQRRLKALQPESAPIDGRQFSELLAYAWRFSRQLNFFDASSTTDGSNWRPSDSWQELLRVEPAFYNSIIASLSPFLLQKEFEAGLAACDEQHTLADWQNKIEDVFNLAAQVFYQSEGFIKNFPALSEARSRIKSYIDNRLKAQAVQLLGLYKTAIIDHQTLENNFRSKLRDWHLDYSSAVPQNYDAVQLRTQLVTDLRNLFEAIIAVYSSLITDAQKSVEQATATSDHQPHIGLFFSFLHLFKNYSQDQMNGLTARHLDFYYRKILKLKGKNAEPDRAHVIFTPAPKTASHKIAANTLFKAGKDKNGRELLYGLTDDFIVSQTKVGQLKNCFGRLVSLDGKEKILTLHQGEMADSRRGTGEPLAEDAPKWPICGNDDYPKARLGFGLSSPILRLSEGRRHISINITVTDITPLAARIFPGQDSPNEHTPLPLPLFAIELSGRKKWLAASPEIRLDPAQNLLQLDLELGFDFKEVADYRAQGLQDDVDLQCAWPLLKILLNQELSEPIYHELSLLEIEKIKLSVGAENIQNLVLQNDLGSLKAAKPFPPFGPTPVVGSNFYVGHRESFAKKLDSLSLSWNWVDLPDDLDDYYQSYSFTSVAQKAIKEKKGGQQTVLNQQAGDLKKSFSAIEQPAAMGPKSPLGPPPLTSKPPAAGFAPTLAAAILDNQQWQPLQDSFALPLIAAEPNSVTFSPADVAADSESPDFKQFGPNLSRGGIRLTLKSPANAFGHKDYPKLYAKAVAASVRQTNPSDELLDQLNPPLTPTFENFSLSYTAEEEHTPFDNKGEFAFYHFHPFGFEKTLPRQLTPQYKAEGYLYIGLKDGKPPESVSLLFQFAEGSGDPFAALPQSITWAYLAADGWQELPANKIISDSTCNLQESGIITLPLPAAAVTDHPAMPTGLHWLRITVSDHTHALHDLISIQAQAATVIFKDNHNDGEQITTALPPGTIAKFKERIPAVKAVSQPYASFGGKPPEEGASFYRRTSERLRHKSRAVTIWDYEHLVLEEFPDIYKVKCLNHTSDCSEISPGQVLVVVIPDLQQKNSRYPLRPAVPQSRLREIEKFLSKKASAFAAIKVVNPLYERIRVNGTVHFYEKYQADKGFYKVQLHADITRMLTPWLYGAQEISFAGRIHRSAIINFIEELPYVDYLSGFEITQLVDDLTLTVAEEAIATTSRSILVSADSHLISYDENSD